MTGVNRPTDDEQRRLAVRERRKNLLVDAGAGTGKTRLVVDRLLEMVAPEDDGDAYTLDRIAAITFTRRAAGELRLRIREEILLRLGGGSLSERRRERLGSALGMLDTAFVGTIHSFADRLLRLCPIEADLSPSYEIVEDEEEVVQEAYLEMLHSAQSGLLGKRFAGTELEARAAEVEATLVEAIEAHLRPQTEERDGYAIVGLDWFVRDLLKRRDHPEVEPAAARFDDASFRRAVREYLDLVRPLTDETKGERWMRRFAERLREVESSADPSSLFSLVQAIKAAVEGDSGLKKTIDFAAGPARDAWDVFHGGLSTDLTDPISRWMACRLVRIRPIAEAIYEGVKRRRGSVDTIDLLHKLAGLMRRDLRARAAYQALFDHVFVDEFQDTDPLQAEVVLFLAERDSIAKSWREVVVGAGRLTLVGDPKQSIYRFRRADVTMYEEIYGHIARQEGTLSVSLGDNFRSVEGLVDWFNARFASVLGTSGSRVLDGATGQVFYKKLTSFRGRTAGNAVHVLPLAVSPDVSANAADVRELEGEALAHYVRWLVEASGIECYDHQTKTNRRVRYRDVAVLALVTTQLHHLFAACDGLSVPYTAAGGTLFLRDPIHRQFILGLRALADADDGVAEAALLRPPFFSIDLWDVLQARAPAEASVDAAAAERGRAARDLVRQLRFERFDRSPGSTARRLLDETAFGRLVALGPNGEQRLRHLRELCVVLDHRAATDALDFDRVTALARSWIDWPVPLDPPRPIWTDAVQVMTVHQAKGLEFPVVVLWDVCGDWRSAERAPVFVVDRSRKQWALRVQGLQWEEPARTDLLERAQGHANFERKRVVYVAATRARDLLVVTHAPGTKFDKAEKYVHASLTGPGASVKVAQAYSRAQPPSWVLAPSVPPSPTVVRELEEQAHLVWDSAIAKARLPRFQPTSVSKQAKGELRFRPKDAPDQGHVDPKRREGRYGPLFGETVHRAIGLALTRKLPPIDAVRHTARMSGLDEHLDEAVADVARTLDALSSAGLSGSPALQLEYPVAIVEQGSLVSGYVDLVAIDGPSCSVVDFKTDRAPAAAARDSHPEYVAQVEAYVRMLSAAELPCVSAPRGGLLWTETGRLEWL